MRHLRHHVHARLREVDEPARRVRGQVPVRVRALPLREGWWVPGVSYVVGGFSLLLLSIPVALYGAVTASIRGGYSDLAFLLTAGLPTVGAMFVGFGCRKLQRAVAGLE